MATKVLNWCTADELACGGDLPAEAYICVPSSIVADPPSTSFAFLDATITGVRPSTCADACGLCKFVYTLSYNDTQLNPDFVLVTAYINEVFCSDCLTDFVLTHAGTAASCNEVKDCLCVVDSETIDFELDEDGCITGEVIVSPDADNQLSAEPDGLFVAAGAGVTVSDSTSINLTETAGDITAVSRISATSGNQVSIAGDGLLVAKGAGVTVSDSTSINLTATAGDITAVSLISATSGNQVSIAGDGLLVPKAAGLTVSDTNSVDLTLSSGALSADSKISATSGNAISIAGDGLLVAKGAGVTVSDTTSIDLTVASGNISGAVLTGWASWAPVLSADIGLTITAQTIISARYFTLGSTCWFLVSMTWQAIGTTSDYFHMTTPVPPAAGAWNNIDVPCRAHDGDGSFPTGPGYRPLSSGHFYIASSSPWIAGIDGGFELAGFYQI